MLWGKHLRGKKMCRICGNRKIRKERTYVKRGKEYTGNELEEMVGQAKKQNKMEEVMLVALGQLAFVCVEVCLCVVVVVLFLPLPSCPESRSYCCCQFVSQSLITWSVPLLLLPWSVWQWLVSVGLYPWYFLSGPSLLLGWRGRWSLEVYASIGTGSKSQKG